MREVLSKIMLVMSCAVGLLMAACALDNVTERTRLPYIDSPPPQTLPPAQQAPVKEETSTKSQEVTK